MRTPLVPFKVPNSEYFQWVGVYDRMARERILFLSQPLNDGVVNQMIATLLYLENEDRKSAVNLYLNVPGALTKSGLALYDTMRTMAFPIGTVNLGVCAHMGAFICAAGTKGRRVALPRSRFILTSPYMVRAARRELRGAMRLRSRPSPRLPPLAESRAARVRARACAQVQSQDGEVPIMQAEDIGREVAEVLRDRTRLVKVGTRGHARSRARAATRARLRRTAAAWAPPRSSRSLVESLAPSSRACAPAPAPPARRATPS
jgi:ATP-dependent Clp protease protease subunit